MRVIMKWIILLFFLLIPTATALVNINTNVSFDLDNGAYLILTPGQSFTNISLTNSSNPTPSLLLLGQNTTIIRFTSTSNKTLSNISYNSLTDILYYLASGTSQNLTTNIIMQNNTYNYTLKIDGTINQTILSSINGVVIFSYNNWSQHEFELIPSGESINITMYNVSGYVTNTLSLPIYQARIDDGTSHVYTDINGYYLLTDVSNIQHTFLARAMIQDGGRIIMFNNATNTTTINSNTAINFTLSERKSSNVADAPGFTGLWFLLAMICGFIILQWKRNRFRISKY